MKINALDTSILFTKNSLRSTLKPRITHYWLFFFIFVLSVFLSFRRYGIESAFGLFLLSIGSILFCYALLTICISKYLITQEGLFLRGPFSRSFKKIDFNDINKISILQGSVQKRLRVGTLKIYTNNVTYSLKGIKNPHQTRELINQEKVSHNERRALLKNIL